MSFQEHIDRSVRVCLDNFGRGKCRARSHASSISLAACACIFLILDEEKTTLCTYQKRIARDVQMPLDDFE